MSTDYLRFSTDENQLKAKNKTSQCIMIAHETGAAKFGHQTAPESISETRKGL